jgi:hypothetical protein
LLWTEPDLFRDGCGVSVIRVWSIKEVALFVWQGLSCFVTLQSVHVVSCEAVTAKYYESRPESKDRLVIKKINIWIK